MRQLTDAGGAVTLSKSYKPYGELLNSAGNADTPYGFTGEWTDSYINLIFLRSRYYASGVGRYINRDQSVLEANLYLYAGANPTNRTDPTGYFSFPIKGLASLILCFDLHSLSHGSYSAGGLSMAITAQGAVDICKLAYSKDMWSEGFFNLGGDLPTTGHDLFGWYLFERGNENHLIFHADQPLTKELSRSTFVLHKRLEYYLFGDTPTGRSDEYRFNMPQQFQCLVDYLSDNRLKASLPLTCVLGTSYYQVKTVDNGEMVGFRVDNRTDLESGTHIAGRFPGIRYGGSVEELIDRDIIRGDDLLIDVINQPYEGKRVVSILSFRSRGKTGTWTDLLGGPHQLGGGALSQTYVWKEERDPCNSFWWFWWMGGLDSSEPPGMQIWYDYGNFTIQPPETIP